MIENAVKNRLDEVGIWLRYYYDVQTGTNAHFLCANSPMLPYLCDIKYPPLKFYVAGFVAQFMHMLFSVSCRNC